MLFRSWYVTLFQKVTETPEWKKYVTDNALQPAFMSGSDYIKWLEEKDAATRQLMKAGGLIK